MIKTSRGVEPFGTIPGGSIPPFSTIPLHKTQNLYMLYGKLKYKVYLNK